MSTRGKTFALEITARARRIGWPVRQADSGEWRITRPDRKVVQVHLSPSDVNAPQAIMRALNECGFEEAEAKFVEKTKRENAKKNREAAAKAEAEAKRLAEAAAAQSTAIVRATGGIPTEDDDFFLTAHDVMKTRQKLITPELARKLLALNPTGAGDDSETAYQRNRKLTRPQVEKWKRVIAADRWKLTHEGVAISNTLKLLDGQHRLTAVSEGETPVEFIVFVGVDEDTFKVIGQGKTRTAADALSTTGATDTNKLSATARLIYLYLSPDRQNWRRTAVTNDETVEMVEQEHEKLVESMNFGNRLMKSVPVIHSAASAAHFLITKKHGADNPHVKAFFDGLMTHRRLEEMDPRVKLDYYLNNSRAQGKRLANMDQLALIIMTWNLIANGREVQYLRYTPKTMQIPEILVVPADSAAPRALMMQQR